MPILFFLACSTRSLFRKLLPRRPTQFLVHQLLVQEDRHFLIATPLLLEHAIGVAR